MKHKSYKNLLWSLTAAFCVFGSLFCSQQVPVYASETNQIADAIQKESASDDDDEIITITNAEKEQLRPKFGYYPFADSDLSTLSADPYAAKSTASASGSYKNINWTFSDYTLTITGSGAIPDFSHYTSTPWYSLNIQKLVIGDGITAIGQDNFACAYSLSSVTFPDSLKTIGDAAFYDCSNLRSVQLPASVTTLGSGAFANCISLVDFSGTGLTTIADYAFQATAMTSFEIPKGITEFPNLAFFDNNHLSSYTVAPGNPVFTEVDGIIYNKDASALLLYPCNKAADTFTIPSNVKTIGKYAFCNTQNLKSVNFSNVTTLEEGAFYCSSLSGELVLSDKITSVGYFTFNSCEAITSVKFGAGLTESSYSMFEDCIGIRSIDFGSLKYLGMQTFSGCDGLVEVTLPSTITQWEGSVFNSCHNLETFTSNGLTEIGYADFAQCYSLKNVHLSKVENIYRQAFANCPKLTEITLPATTKFVDANAFSASVKITCLNKELVKFGANGLHYGETITISGQKDYKKAFEVLNLVNQTRKKYGLSALTMDTSLLEDAMTRAGELAVLFSHTRPDSSSCFSANKYMIAENVALGQRSASDVMSSWMNSPGHRSNILMDGPNTIGIGCFYIDGIYTWVQCFGSMSSPNPAQQKANQTISQSIHIPRGTFTEAATTGGIIWGEPESYTYKVCFTASQTTYNAGNKTQLKLLLVNPGFGITINFTSPNISWSSDNTSVATVNSGGTVSFINGGTATITGKTKYYKSSAKFSVISTPKLTLKNATVTYTGKAKRINAATVTGSAGTITYSYYSDSKCTKKLSSLPVNAGTYYVRAKSSKTAYSNAATSNVAKLIIQKATPKITLKDKVATYTGKGIKISKATVSGSTGTVTYTYYSNAKCTKKLSKCPVKVGTYYVKATVASTKNYKSVTSKAAKLVVKKANTLKLTVTSKKYKAASTGKLSRSNSFDIKPKNAKGTVTYVKSSNCKNYITVTSKGKVTLKKGTPKGTYKITVKASGTSTYLSKSLNVTIKVY